MTPQTLDSLNQNQIEKIPKSILHAQLHMYGQQFFTTPSVP